LTRYLCPGILTFGVAIAAAFGVFDCASAQGSKDYPQRESTPTQQIVQKIDENETVTLRGNTHPFASPLNDRGVVPPEQPVRRMLLLLSRSRQQESALDQLVSAQQDPLSPSFHRWLTPDQYGASFGVAAQDLATVSDWLASHGFRDLKANHGRTIVEFSGTAAQVQGAFHTSIHHYEANGALHSAKSGRS